MNPVMVVRTEVDDQDRPIARGCWLWCPGCEEVHRPRARLEDGSGEGIVWDWDGNLEKPTFSPSYLTWTSTTRCHSYIRNGQWQFLSDCTHELAGQTVDMVPVPDWLAAWDRPKT